MKISELEERLKYCRKNFGDANISFGYVDEVGVEVCHCNVNMKFNEYEDTFDIIVEIE